MPIPKKKKDDEPKTARERVYSELKRWIVEGTLQPDEKISDMELAEYFSVSRTPVREAMQLLADQKLINIYPGKESRIAPINMENTKQVYQIIAKLHCLAVEFAFPHINEKVLSELTEINHKFGEQLRHRNSASAHQYDRQFHGVFLKIASNDFLINFIDVLDCHVERIERLYYNSRLIDISSFDHHKAIIDALSKKDLDSAIQKTSENWLYTVDIIFNASQTETDAS